MLRARPARGERAHGRLDATMRLRHVLLAVAAGLAIADASIVTLALPELLRALDTTVEGVAAVLGVYTVVLAAALLPAERAMRRVGAPRTAAAGLALFAVASAVCAAAGSLPTLLVARALQAVGGAAALVAAFAVLEPHGAASAAGRRLWLGAAVLSAALGPALGGALTEALSWRAIFYVPAPVCALAALIVLAEPRRPTAPAGADGSGWAAGVAFGPLVALGLVSAALTAVLFLLVLLLVAGWDVTPLRAAITVTVIPAFALAGARIGGPAATRAAAGCALVASGVLALAFLPDARLLWTVAPQAAAGLGMGLSLPALAGELLPERDARDAARLLTARHVGIALALAILAPVVSGDLDDATQRARLRGVAVVLDAKLPPAEKLGLAPKLLAGVDAQEPRAGLRRALAATRPDVDPEHRPAFDALARRTDDTLVLAVGEAFRTAFLVTGALALLGTVAVLAGGTGRRRALVAVAAAGATALALPLAYVAVHERAAPEPVALRDPCQARGLPHTGGIGGFLQDRALQLLDLTACRLGSSREELVLALADPDDRRQFERKYGVDPRSVTSLLGGLLAG